MPVSCAPTRATNATSASWRHHTMQYRYDTRFCASLLMQLCRTASGSALPIRTPCRSQIFGRPSQQTLPGSAADPYMNGSRPCKIPTNLATPTHSLVACFCSACAFACCPRMASFMSKLLPSLATTLRPSMEISCWRSIRRSTISRQRQQYHPQPRCASPR